jgi:hypothetical protein
MDINYKRDDHESDKTFFECIKYAHENGCPWDIFTCKWAASWGYINSLKYAIKNGCPLDKDTCWFAASNGRLECLKYLHENECPFNDWTSTGATANGHLECLKYLHENGCPWSSETCVFAANYGHLDCLKYAYENGCPYPEELLSTIVKKILIPKWRDSVKSRPIVYYWMECSAKTSCGQNGRARIEDINSFENDFKFIL